MSWVIRGLSATLAQTPWSILPRYETYWPKRPEVFVLMEWPKSFGTRSESPAGVVKSQEYVLGQIIRLLSLISSRLGRGSSYT